MILLLSEKRKTLVMPFDIEVAVGITATLEFKLIVFSIDLNYFFN